MNEYREFVLRGLLQHNYFPTTRPAKEEIPPIFSSEGLTPEVAAQLIGSGKFRKGGYDQLEYRLTRYNSVSRLLSMPHPLPHVELCFALCEHWDKFAYIDFNPNSQIKPRQNDDGRLIIMNNYGGVLGKSQQNLNQAFGKRYQVSTDITNCFPSIYTHAIPWALVGRNEAKAARLDHTQWFNQVDKKFRACRRDETQGVAIGPGTSNVAVEIVLGRIDEKLRNRFTFVRYIDDYECFCSTEQEAMDFVRELEKLAAGYKLNLNVQKTKIFKLPQPVTADWILELGRYLPQAKEPSVQDIFRFLDMAVCLAEKHPENSVLKYAVSAVNDLSIDYPSNQHCLDYLLSLSFHHSDLLPKLKSLMDGMCTKVFGQVVDLSYSSAKLEDILIECAALRRSDGMCWALYLLGRSGHHISQESARKITETEDALAILTLYWSGEKHKQSVIEFAKSLDVSDVHELDRYWLLLYQIFYDGHIDNPYSDEPCFQILKENGVSFMHANDGIDSPAMEIETGMT